MFSSKEIIGAKLEMSNIVNAINRKLATEWSYCTSKYKLPPVYISLIITYECNFRCQVCDLWKKKKIVEISNKKWIKISRQLIEILHRDSFIEINGGEPLLKKDLVLAIIRNLNCYFNKVSLNTNGSLLTAPVINELQSAGLDSIKISFYSLDEKIHNFLRGNPIAYKNALNVIKLSDGYNVKTNVGVLITSKNIKTIPELINYLNQFKNTGVILQPLDEKLYSLAAGDMQKNTLPQDLWPNKKEVEELFDWIFENIHRINVINPPHHLKMIKNYYLNPKNILSFRCFAGQRSLIIYPDGKVSLCFKYPNIGDLKTQKIGEILASKSVIQQRKAIKECRKYCRVLGCNYSRGFFELLKNYN